MGDSRGFGRKRQIGRLTGNFALLAGSLALSLVAVELGLRIAGYSFELAPESVEFGYPNPIVRRNYFRIDPDLWWVTKKYQLTLANIAENRRPVLFLGDSCTQFGSYPAQFISRVQAVHPYVSAGGKLGVGGWSSHQGLKQLVRDVIPLRPRAVTVYFGWNDHWAGFGVEDAEIDSLQLDWLGPFRESRTAQLLFQSQLAFRNWLRGDRPLRVPPKAFRHNMTEIVRVARANGIEPVLITAPTSLRRGFEPPYLGERFAVDLAELVPLHERYVEIVREVAEAESAVLCDAAKEFERYPDDTLRNHYFKGDGIHPTRAGDFVLAEFLFECFERSPRLRDVWKPFGPDS